MRANKLHNYVGTETEILDSVSAALGGAQLEGGKVTLENVRLPVDTEATLRSSTARTQELHENLHWRDCGGDDDDIDDDEDEDSDDEDDYEKCNTKSMNLT